eukprot:CAMPEP_0202345536 /NCGR_PEP_ID=MMETSP1126-20121109/4733_1 /ASSEMBLY_ACC=CAM_ASM_000457 /TAXON_ID=3047 /ORGANISM="Dunaliella tertiolecta, Strain CCMP1320" /LENGTH=71 /DNA_ID=CAMNT_0048936855 /DNA_START=132 /DNA_END=347 /DNA_ORIENTATION=-
MSAYTGPTIRHERVQRSEKVNNCVGYVVEQERDILRWVHTQVHRKETKAGIGQEGCGAEREQDNEERVVPE